MLCIYPFLGGLTIWAHQSHEPRALSSAPRYPFNWHLICHSPVGCWDSGGPRPIPAGPTWLNTAVGVVTENIAPVTTPPIITHLAAKYKTCATRAITTNVINIQKKQYFYILHNIDTTTKRASIISELFFPGTIQTAGDKHGERHHPMDQWDLCPFLPWTPLSVFHLNNGCQNLLPTVFLCRLPLFLISDVCCLSLW